MNPSYSHFARVSALKPIVSFHKPSLILISLTLSSCFPEPDREKDGKATSKSGLAFNGISYYGKLGRLPQRVAGLEWNIILRKAENREEWRKLVVKSTVVPQRSARLWESQEKKTT